MGPDAYTPEYIGRWIRGWGRLLDLSLRPRGGTGSYVRANTGPRSESDQHHYSHVRLDLQRAYDLLPSDSETQHRFVVRCTAYGVSLKQTARIQRRRYNDVLAIYQDALRRMATALGWVEAAAPAR